MHVILSDHKDDGSLEVVCVCGKRLSFDKQATEQEIRTAQEAHNCTESIAETAAAKARAETVG